MDRTFGALLRRHRRSAGLTQEALAARAGISGQAVGALERGDRRFPHRDTVDRLADALGLTADQRAAFTATAARNRVPPAREPAPPGSSCPRQLPAEVAHFLGREAQTDVMINLLTSSATAVVVAIAGMGGVGKTTLAVHVAHRVAPSFPDGQLYVDLRGAAAPLPPPEALAQMMRAIGAADDAIPAGLAEAAARFRTALAGRRVLLVLDDAANAEQVLPLLPGAPDCAAIVTGRGTLSALPQAHHLQLDVLAEREAVGLLAAIAGAARIEAEPDAAARVVAHCGRLPLAVHLAGVRLAARPAWPVAHLAERLADEHRRLDELERDDVGVRASFAVSVDHLDPRDAVAYTLLALPDGPDISIPVAARLLDSSEPAAERLLDRLADLHLLEAIAPGRYRLHDLLRTYARDRAVATVPEADRRAALRRVLELFVAVAWRSLALVMSGSVRQSWADECWAAASPSFATSAEAFGWLDEHRPHLVGITRTPGVPRELLVRLSIGLFTFYLSRGHWLDWAEVSRAALDASSGSPDRLARAIVLMDLGIAEADLAHARSASQEEALTHLERGLTEFRSLGHRRGTAACLTNLSEVLELGGELDAAIARAEESLAINRELGEPYGEAVAGEYLGSLYGKAGETDRELALYRASLRRYEQLGHDRDRAGVLRRIGAAYRRTGRIPAALSALRRSRSLFGQVGDPAGEAAALEELGRLHLDRRDRAAALEALREGLALAEDYGDRQRQARIRDLLDTPPQNCIGEL